jgi:two-component system OmpR family response regulator
MRVLVVEDDRRVAEVIGATLTAAGHDVVTAGTRAGADVALDDGPFALAIVDVGLPDGSGIELCRAARARGVVVPILLLTARTGVDDRVAGLDAGADDYLGKPFAPAELSARVRALGRRGPRFIDSVRRFGTLTFDRDRRSVDDGGTRVALTPREFEVVALLAWRDGRVVARDELLELVWGEVTEGAAASLEVLVGRVRRKLDGAAPGCIRTIRGVGYAWELPASKHD